MDGSSVSPIPPWRSLAKWQHKLRIWFDVKNQRRSRAATYSPCPFSKLWPRSTLTRSKVCPWDLWIDIAQARINGTCILRTSTLPTGPWIVNSAAGKTTSFSLVNLTMGHNCWRLKVLLAKGRNSFDTVGGEYDELEWLANSAIAICRSCASRMFVKPTTLPKLPLTRTPFSTF